MPTPADGFDLRADGTVLFQFDDSTKVELKRPTLGQYRLLIEKIQRIRLSAGSLVADEADDGSNTLNALNDQVIEWLGDVIKELGDGTELPPEDNLPAWLLNSELPADLIAHWQKIPSRRGVR